MSGSNAVNLYRSSPRQIRSHIEDCIFAGLVPMTRGSPGVGKTQIHHQIANDNNLFLLDHRMSTSEPTDFSGLPEFNDGKARFAPFEELFPLTSTPLPKGYDGWLLFLDEMNSASRSVMAAAYKLILDRMTGQHKLHERVVICCAGNLDTDKAITNNIGTAMQSRLVHLELEVSFREWLEDVALRGNYDARIIAYLSQYESKLMDFDPNHTEHTFCCPRTWEFMNKLLQGVLEIPDEKVALYAGTITSGVAVDFVQFTKIYKDMLSIRQILADPDGCAVPHDASTKWALITHMMEKVDEKTYADLARYANRFPLDFRILFFRSTQIRQPQLREHPAFAKAMVDLARYLHS